jgi:ABC-type oligopeptide transport system ATPase subunit
VVQNVCDWVAVMNCGKTVEIGKDVDIIDHPQHEYTRTRLAAVSAF